MHKVTTKQNRTKQATPCRNLTIQTPRGSIRLAIFEESGIRSGKPSLKHDGGVPAEIDITLRGMFAAPDPITKQPINASWTDEPLEQGFYVRWKPGEGLSEVYYGGEETPSEFLVTGNGARFFGPFQLPI
jgi:hypothetical protein